MDIDEFAFRWRAVWLLIAFALATCTALAEEGVLVLVVMDTEQHPFANVQIGLAGDAGSPQFSDQNGKARLKLAPNTKPAAWVTLLLMGAPGGLDLAFISPYDGRIRVPPFDNESDNYDPVILAKHSDKAVLESGSGMLAIHANQAHAVAAAKKKAPTPTSRDRLPDDGLGVARLQTVSLKFGAPEPSHAQSSREDDAHRQALAAVAKMFGLSVTDVQAAMNHWGGSDLAWQAMLLTSLLDDGGTDPFSAVRVVNGNITFGTGSWNLRECTLQPLLLKFQQHEPERFAAIMGQDAAWLTKTMQLPCKDSFTIASERLLGSPNSLDHTWRNRFIQLGNDHAFQHLQVEQMERPTDAAQSLALQFGLQSERAALFCYDMALELGSDAMEEASASVLQDIAAYQQQFGREPDEQERLATMAVRMIEQESEQSLSSEASAAFVSRVTLFSQGVGTVAGRYYDLNELGIEGPPPSSASLPVAQPKKASAEDNPPASSSPASSALSTPGQPPPESETRGQKQLVELLNGERATQGLQPLVVDEGLTEAACKHSELMATHQVLSHQFKGEPALEMRVVAENLYSDRQAENIDINTDVPSTQKSFMHSPDHRANILNPNYNAVGVCVVKGHRRVYVTEDFARRLTKYSEPEADAIIQRTVEDYVTAHGMPAPVRKPHPQLRQMACDMASKDSVQSQDAAKLPGVHTAVAWTTAVPGELPSDATELLSHPMVAGYSLGACFAPSTSHPGGVYWVVMISY